MSEKDDTIRAALDQGVADAFAGNGRMATRWFVVIEETDPDTGTSLWTLASDELTEWDALGLLDYALEHEKHKVRRILDRRDEERGEEP